MKKAIANSPLDRGLLTQPQTETVKLKPAKGRFTTEVDYKTATRLRRASVELREPVSHIVNEALNLWLANKEKQTGQNFDKPIDKLRQGRPVKVDNL